MPDDLLLIKNKLFLVLTSRDVKKRKKKQIKQKKTSPKKTRPKKPFFYISICHMQENTQTGKISLNVFLNLEKSLNCEFWDFEKVAFFDLYITLSTKLDHHSPILFVNIQLKHKYVPLNDSLKL